MHIWKPEICENMRPEYYCDSCDYRCSRKFLWEQHLATRKHHLETHGNASTALQTSIQNQYSCPDCGKGYRYRSGLWKHRQRCKLKAHEDAEQHAEQQQAEQQHAEQQHAEQQHAEQQHSEQQHAQQQHAEQQHAEQQHAEQQQAEQQQAEQQQAEQQQVEQVQVSDMKGLMQEVVQCLQRDAEIKNEMLRQLREQQAIIKEMIPKIGSNNNTQFNINLFLNEHCRDAINMTDFMESLSIQTPDLLYTRNNGLAEGITSVFVNHLRRLDMSKRPIHCTDAKRETLYIKDNNEWERDLDNVRLRTAINDVAIKQRKAISDWEREHPNWSLSESGKEEYLMLIKSVMEDANESSSENRIIKSIAKETTIDAINRKK